MAKSSNPPVFCFHSHQIRTVVEGNQIWFAAKDVCAALDIDWSGKTLAVIPDCWQSMGKLPTLSRGLQQLKLISEPAVYKLAFRSNKPEADAFTNWVASEVLPTIHKTGRYEVESKQKALPEATQKTLPGTGAEWRGHELMQRLQAASDECYSVYEELCALVAGLYDDLRNMEPGEVSGLASMLYAIRAAKNTQAGLMHAYNQYCHTAGKRRGRIPDAWDKDVAVSEIKAYRIMAERMLGWDVPEGMLSRL